MVYAALDWRGPEWLHEVEEGEVIIISHNRGTWGHRDPARNNCVVVTRRGDNFKEFGPDAFPIKQIAAWTRFDPPKLPESARAEYRVMGFGKDPHGGSDGY